MNRLKDRYRCLTLDWRDTGNSGSSHIEEYSTETMAGDVAGLIRGLNLGTVHLVGLSMGGAVAQEVALNYPELVGSLVLASTFCDRPVPVEVPAALRTVGNLRQQAAVKLHNTCDRLHLITAPTLVVAGSRDTSTTPESQYTLSTGLADARYELIQERATCCNSKRRATSTVCSRRSSILTLSILRLERITFGQNRNHRGRHGRSRGGFRLAVAGHSVEVFEKTSALAASSICSNATAPLGYRPLTYHDALRLPGTVLGCRAQTGKLCRFAAC